MSPYKWSMLYILSLVYCTRAQYRDLNSNSLFSKTLRLFQPKIEDINLMADKLLPLRTSQQYFTQQLEQFRRLLQPTQPVRQSQEQDRVQIQLFYECLCPDCIRFDTEQFVPTIKILAKYLDVYVYPYGNAQTIIHAGGKFEFLCQHGPSECYGNMLHACAIDILGNITQAIEFNGCMMRPDQDTKGSDNNAADKCGQLMSIDSEAIKHCAISPRGMMLLKQYGDESHKVGFKYVPYILLNGRENDGEHFLRDVCDAFQNPPPECNEIDSF